MKKLLAVLILCASVAFAQQATINTPITRTSIDNYKVSELLIRANTPGQSAQVFMIASAQDSGGVEVTRVNFSIPDSAHSGATVAGFVTALITVRATETGTDARKANFRALGYFSDQGYLPGVTLIP